MMLIINKKVSRRSFLKFLSVTSTALSLNLVSVFKMVEAKEDAVKTKNALLQENIFEWVEADPDTGKIIANNVRGEK